MKEVGQALARTSLLDFDIEELPIPFINGEFDPVRQKHPAIVFAYKNDLHHAFNREKSPTARQVVNTNPAHDADLVGRLIEGWQSLKRPPASLRALITH